MNRRQIVAAVAVSLAIGFAASQLPGCAGRKAAPSKPEGLTLKYRLPQGKPVTYRTTRTANQTMEVMNQLITAETTKTMIFSLSPGEVKNGRQHLAVTIDSMQAGLTTPEGGFTADVSSVLGRSFEMYLSTVGKELDITGADVIQYSLGAAGQRGVKSDFQAIFPDLAGSPVTIGGTWTTTDTIDVDESGMVLKIASENLNTFEALESLNGIECARIRTTTTGTIVGEGEQQGALAKIDTQTEGTGLWYFDHQSGMLAKWISDLSIKGTVTVGGAQGMQIPMNEQMKTETSLVR